MTRRLWLPFIALLIPVQAFCADQEADAILARARARAAEKTFSPFSYVVESHTCVRNGDDELEHEERSRETFIQWTADSTETVSEEVELIFSDEEEPAEKEESDEEEERKEGGVEVEFDFFSPEHEGDYEFRFEGWSEREGRRLAEFELRPRKRAHEFWKGKLWVDPASGALRAVDLEPSKRRFGLKRMRMKADLMDLEDWDFPRNMTMDLEVKIVLLFHKKISTRLEFSQWTEIPEAP